MLFPNTSATFTSIHFFLLRMSFSNESVRLKNLSKLRTQGVTIFHAGTSKIDNEVCINGGRVLGVTAEGDSLEDAVALVYESVFKIDSTNLVYRKDIVQKGLRKKP